MTSHTESRITLFMTALFFATSFAEAAVPQPKRTAEPEAGMTLRGTGPNAETRLAPALDTEVAIDVTGLIARVQVRQTFRNPDYAWVEGIYVFPLPDKAAIDALRMRIGDRIVEGEIRERAQAEKTYDKAKRAGKQASLIEQERPNIFTASVANIPPDGDIIVEIEYQQRLRFDSGAVSLRFPSVVGPRFIPGTRPIAGIGGVGLGSNTNAVPDAERITPPVRHPAAGPANPLAIRVRLDPGMPISLLRSPSHKIAASADDDGRYGITLKDGDATADRDFVLQWHPDTGNEPFAALFRETKGGHTYLMAVIAPPNDDVAVGPRIAREVVFVIDTSGSMHGDSIAQARDALAFALGRLQPGDHFNVVRFSSDATALFDRSKPANAPNLLRAKGFIERLHAEGGTNIDAALEQVLDGLIGGSRLRQIVLVTDGAVGNETALFSRIRREIGDSRLFTIGIGSAPNSHFMRRAAQFGRGTFTHIGNTREVAGTMSSLFAKLERPALTQIAATFDGAPIAEQWPLLPPDLYHGEPLVLTARLPRAEGKISVLGMRDDLRWAGTFDVASARTGTGIAKLWAREGIAAAMDGLALGADPDAVRASVLELALSHGLVSKYTSLIAIDRTPIRPVDASLDRRAVPVDLPAGWNYAAVFGGQTATPATFQLLLGITSLFIGGLLLAARRRFA